MAGESITATKRLALNPDRISLVWRAEALRPDAACTSPLLAQIEGNSATSTPQRLRFNPRGEMKP